MYNCVNVDEGGYRLSHVLCKLILNWSCWCNSITVLTWLRFRTPCHVLHLVKYMGHSFKSIRSKHSECMLKVFIKKHRVLFALGQVMPSDAPYCTIPVYNKLCHRRFGGRYVSDANMNITYYNLNGGIPLYMMISALIVHSKNAKIKNDLSVVW